MSFLIFWNSINLAYISQLGNENLVFDYVFTSQRESHSLPDTGFLLTLNYHSGHPPPPLFLQGEGVEPQTKFSKRGCFIEPQLLEDVAGKEGGDFSQAGVAIFT